MSSKSIAYVISLAPYVANQVVFWFGPTYHTVPKKDGEPYGVTEVQGSSCSKDFGGDQKEYYDVPAKSIAEDLVRGLEDHGLFVVESLPPSEAELAQATARQQAWYRGLIIDADSTWARTQDPKQISFHARVAAKSLNLKRDWASDMSMMAPCKACREMVSIEAAKCPHCTAILNYEKARDFGLLTPDQEKFAIKKGWLQDMDALVEDAPAKAPLKKAVVK